MAEIFHIDEHDVPWAEFQGNAGSAIRFKALTEGVDTSTRVQYIEYAPDLADPVHRHDEGEVFLVTDGALAVGDTWNGPGSIICIPRDVDYAVRAGPDGARFFRVVVP